jgi:polygalacturonase
MKQVANIIQFGADPTGTRDSTDAIQAAIDFVSLHGGAGTVFLSPGEYVVEETLEIPHSSWEP